MSYKKVFSFNQSKKKDISCARVMGIHINHRNGRTIGSKGPKGLRNPKGPRNPQGLQALGSFLLDA